MRKKGQAVMGTVMIIAVLGLLGLFGWVAWSQGWFSAQTIVSEKDCSTAPSISLNGIDALNKGTAVTITQNHTTVNGDYVGTSAPSGYQRGDVVELIVSSANYLDKKLAPITLDCGTNIIKEEVYATSTNTFRVFNTDGNPLSDNIAGGSTNQSTSSSPITLKICIDSTVDQSTGDLVIVVEANETTLFDTIKLSGLPGAKDVSNPDSYSANVANSLVKSFEVSALLDGVSECGSLTFSPESSQTLSGPVYITAYSKQWFADKDGTFKYGIENSDGTTKYEDTWDFDFHIGN